MSSSITEWEFTADIASWINELIAMNPDLPFSAAKCEQRSTGSRKRRDITLLDDSQRIVLTGEVKLPYRSDGGSPYNSTVVSDARSKANRAGTSFYFTWNVNQFVLWETEPTTPSWKNRSYKDWKVTQIHHEGQLEAPPAQHAIKTWLDLFLHDFAAILRGTSFIGAKAPDKQFVDLMESALALPIRYTFEELIELYKEEATCTLLEEWMRKDLGFVITDDQGGINENLDRAARFSCYNLVIKLVFYDALLKRYGAELPRLEAPDHVDTGERLHAHLEAFFHDAKRVTGDYETVFGEDHLSVGNRVPFYSDNAVVHWAALINDINEFDFTRLNYEIIGNIFERLISPELRHKYGQFYTCVEVVDVINSFCILKGTETVMDPACGGGTFLVRAYARKRALQPGRRHPQLLSDLYGVDIDDFATHLTTTNLATRDLIDQDNYPQIVREDFFDVESEDTFISLPRSSTAQGLGKGQKRDVYIPGLDAVVGNPPYIRQEEIPRHRKKRYNELVKKESNAVLSFRSDIHCYFWPHASSFLKESGYLCFLTSSQWLDTKYGFRLQNWILLNFEIIAVMESFEEPWFVGARVVTAITILRRQKDEVLRMRNVVRFVQIYEPLEKILAHDGTIVGAIKSADSFRDEILGLSSNEVNEQYRANLVSQGCLWNEGVQLSVAMRQSEELPDKTQKTQRGSYFGGKWGMHLRAPDLWFELLEESGDRMRPLGDLAYIWRGITTGDNNFFFPIDCSRECLKQEQNELIFEAEHGVPRRDVVSAHIKLVKCGEGMSEIRPIESCYLEPEVHSIMEIDGYSVGPEDCSRMILLVKDTPEKLEGTYVLDYIQWGEKQGWHEKPTCRARETKESKWYNITSHERPMVILPKIQQYRLIAFLNPNRLNFNCSLMGVSAGEYIPDETLCGILNSTPAILSRILHARMLGNEGTIQLDVYSANMMLVPNPIGTSQQCLNQATQAFRAMNERKALSFLSERRLRRMSFKERGKESELAKFSEKCELDMADRRTLDDAVLQMMGINSAKRRTDIINEVYEYLRVFFEWTRRKEEKAIRNKKRSKHRSHRTTANISEEIHGWIEEHEPMLLRRYDPHFLDLDKPFDTYNSPAEGKPRIEEDLLQGVGVRFTKNRSHSEVAFIPTRHNLQATLLAFLVNNDSRNMIRIPFDEEECRRVHCSYREFLAERKQRLLELIELRTADEETQKAIYKQLCKLV